MAAASASLPFIISSSHSLPLSPPPFLPFKNPNFSRHRRRHLPPLLRVATPPTAPAPISEEEGGNFETLEIEEGSVASSSDSDSFSWRDHWYPVSLIEDLDPRRPTPFQLLNREIVLWKDPNAGEWVAFDDRCPHRLAPLSVFFLFPKVFVFCCYNVVVARIFW